MGFADPLDRSSSVRAYLVDKRRLEGAVRLAVEDRIVEALGAGRTPSELIAEGFKKSTVYKVAQRLRATAVSVPSPQWSTIITPDPASLWLLPGQTQVLHVSISNHGPWPWLVTRMGVAPAWLHAENQWTTWNDQFLLQPGQSHKCSPVVLSIPPDLTLGEHELTVGCYGQRIDPSTSTTTSPVLEWSQPLILRVQHRPRGKPIVISTSDDDVGLARRLARSLENVGIASVVARDEVPTRLRGAIETGLLVVALCTAIPSVDTNVATDVGIADAVKRRTVILSREGAAIGHWENRTRMVSLDNLQPIADAVGKAVADAQREAGQTTAIVAMALLGALSLFFAASGEQGTADPGEERR